MIKFNCHPIVSFFIEKSKVLEITYQRILNARNRETEV